MASNKVSQAPKYDWDDESHSEKLARKAKDSPFMIIGEYSTCQRQDDIAAFTKDPASIWTARVEVKASGNDRLSCEITLHLDGGALVHSDSVTYVTQY